MKPKTYQPPFVLQGYWGQPNSLSFFVLAKASGNMDRLIKKAIWIKLYPDNIERKDSNSAKHGIQISVYLGTPTHINHETPKKSTQKQNKMIWRQGHQVKQHGEKLDSDGWPHSLTPPSHCTVHQQKEVSMWQSGINISDTWWFTTSTLMKGTEDISETLVFSATFTRLIALEKFNTFIGLLPLQNTWSRIKLACIGNNSH
jgi:hypothetical protein